MVQIRSRLDVADNTGARMATMIGVIGKATLYARIGDVITANVKEASATGTVKKGEVVQNNFDDYPILRIHQTPKRGEVDAIDPFVEARVLVTQRIPPLRVDGRVVHQVGLPYHWGPVGYVTGDAANDLLGVAMDPNVFIGEYKAATCDLRAGRRPRGPAARSLVEEYRDG